MTSLPSAPDLDELTITIVVDNATDTLSSIAPGIPQLPEIAYLLGGIPPTGLRVRVTGIAIAKVVRGQLVVEHAHTDALGLLTQIGVIPRSTTSPAHLLF